MTNSTIQIHTLHLSHPKNGQPSSGGVLLRPQRYNIADPLVDYCSGVLSVGYSEIDPYACEVYQRHFHTHRAFGNIEAIDVKALPDFDLLCGGFPCQSFSVAGRRGGFCDRRGLLFFEIARLLAAKKPRLLLLENVKGLLSVDGGNTFRSILKTLDELGYDAQWQVLNSKDFGVPQNRERLYLVGHLRGTARPGVFPYTPADGSVFEDGSTPCRSQCSPFDTRLKCCASDGRHQILEFQDLRRLSVVECERLQGFPDHWTAGLSNTQRFKCLGNAVTTTVVAAIAHYLIN